MRKTNQNYKNYALLAILGLAVFLGGISIYSNNLNTDYSSTELGLVEGSTTQSGLTPPTASAACMIAAISSRDRAISLAFETKNQFAAGALAVREAAQKNIWATASSTAERKAALKKSWTAYQKDIDRYVVKEWQAAKKAAWGQYLKNRKFCGSGAVSDDSEASESKDSKL